MTDFFLERLDFLTPDQRVMLRAEDLDSAGAFAHVDVALLQRLGLTIGKASRLLAAARDAGSAPAAAPQTVVVIAEPPDVRTRIAAALTAAHDDPSKIGALLELGVDRVVVGEDGRVHVSATQSMRAHAAPVGATWAGLKVVSVRDLSTPAVWCSPRTGRPLQDGKDEVTGTPWSELGLAGLRLAAFGYEQGMFDGLSEEAVLTSISTGDTRLGRITKRMAALDVKPEDMDPKVVWKATFVASRAPVSEAPPPRAVRGGSLVASLSTLFLGCFSTSELRRLLRYMPGGADFVAGLPDELSSPAAFASAAADALIRQGLVNRDFRNLLVQERPRRAAEIDALFSAAGVL